MKARYETILVGAPGLSEEEMGAIVSGLETTIAEGHGTLIRTEPWGKKRLAYRVGKFDEGHYTLLFYDGEGAVVQELERKIRMNENLIRFLTVKVDWEEKVALAEKLKAARRRPEPAARAVEESGFGEPESLEPGEFDGGVA